MWESIKNFFGFGKKEEVVAPVFEGKSEPKVVEAPKAEDPKVEAPKVVEAPKAEAPKAEVKKASKPRKPKSKE